MGEEVGGRGTAIGDEDASVAVAGGAAECTGGQGGAGGREGATVLVEEAGGEDGSRGNLVQGDAIHGTPRLMHRREVGAGTGRIARDRAWLRYLGDSAAVVEARNPAGSRLCMRAGVAELVDATVSKTVEG